ncbi:FAD-binding and (Fe-S)-binding domain-containing protein [Nocardiopsis sp. HUAS JQ3]|uniref:FAD-binding and (Fe-S)-binding domain-containing protein n=1 Tax=Nocardiopsis sp. HUAS JQ3 TaxID=3061629 RepID=UPI0023A99CDB|nr:FAD-binding and (Fe-S)-binding domain-containing protein [Nocardiopsis sp. HUAS JQ3]WDZ93543.1 FAD-binding and (Fe-S)-binding domain-containing protein [Nocardiopsis sp. HUAS JQ3]
MTPRHVEPESGPQVSRHGADHPRTPGPRGGGGERVPLNDRADHDGTDDLAAAVGAENVLTSATDLVRYSSDASPYLQTPRVVVLARTGDDVAEVFRFASRNRRRVVLRAAGTSLNGQAQGDDILLDVRRHFDHVSVEEKGAILRSAPGVILSRANARLAPYGRMLGPDPASSAAASVGGVVANNASGMTCGVRANSYRTVESLRIVLPSGTRVDTAAPDADTELARAEPELVARLLRLRDELRADPRLAARVRSKFAIKNTSGYRLDALLDGDTPVRILRGLLIGSQGTLGFLEEVTFRTVPNPRWKTTAFLRFPDLAAASAVVPALMDLGARAAELLDNLSLRSTRSIAGAPEWTHAIGAHDAGLLVEFRSSDPADLDRFEREAREAVRGAALGGEFTRDSRVSNGFWAVRKGLLTALGASRPPGTVLLGEDVCVPPARIAEAAVALRDVLAAHGFDASVAGHASAGNLHFTLVFDPADPADVERYARCVEEVVALVVDRFDGSLKGEHGSGRNMAPFLEREWGPRLAGMMRRVKDALDPDGILGHGVLFTDDPRSHLRDLKTLPAVAPLLDGCIECGFCEPVCPSRDLTTTPRQRIVLRREIARRGGSDAELEKEYGYAAVDTCAGDGSCATACPVGIDTGHAMKDLRHARHGAAAERGALALARRWAVTERLARMLLRLARACADAVGDRPVRAASLLARRILGAELVPEWLAATPGPAPAPRRGPRERPAGTEAVYVPSCVNRIFGAPPGAADPTTVTAALPALADRAGRTLWTPPDVAGTCCGTVWQSKGYRAAHAHTANELVERLWRWSDEGRLPVVVDSASCTLGVLREAPVVLDTGNRARHASLTVVDALTWARTELLPRLTPTRRLDRAVLHPTCAAGHLGTADDLHALTAALAEEVVQPVTATCCGFAGDRGFLRRELTESATRGEAAELAGTTADAYVSGNRPCEIGLQHATGHPYESVLVALDRATRPPKEKRSSS